MGIILGILIAVAAIVCAFFGLRILLRTKQASAEKRRTGIIATVFAAVFVVLFVFVPFGFEQVETGEIAVVKVWGEAKSVRTEGLHFKNIATTKYELYDLKTQDVRSTFEAYTKDGQAVTVQLTLQFRIQADKVIEIAKIYGSLTILKQRVDVIGMVGAKEIISTYDAMTLIQERSQLSGKVAANIQGQFNSFYITVTQILVTDIAFTEVFENMIEEKKLAEQQLEKAKIELDKQLAEAENKVKIAEAQAREKLAQAQGEADAMKALAEAEAEKLKVIAQAEAQALRLKSVELARSLGIRITSVNGAEAIDSSDPNISKLASYLEYIAYLEAWDGKLPEVMLDGSTSYIIPSR